MIILSLKQMTRLIFIDLVYSVLYGRLSSPPHQNKLQISYKCKPAINVMCGAVLGWSVVWPGGGMGCVLGMQSHGPFGAPSAPNFLHTTHPQCNTNYRNSVSAYIIIHIDATRF